MHTWHATFLGRRHLTHGEANESYNPKITVFHLWTLDRALICALEKRDLPVRRGGEVGRLRRTVLRLEPYPLGGMSLGQWLNSLVERDLHLARAGTYARCGWALQRRHGIRCIA
jgi:hypothetical protein